MRLCFYRDGEQDRPGVVVGDDVIDVARAMRVLDGDRQPPKEVFGAATEENLRHLRDLAGRCAQLDLVESGVLVGPVRDLRLRAPVGRPAKILCIGLNYVDHVREVGLKQPERPHVFSKLPTALSGPHDDIEFPPETSQLDYEAELALMIERRARKVSADVALDHVAGYLVANDVTARDWQFDSDGQMTLGKGFDTFFPCGPWLVTADEVPDPQRLGIRCTVNGEVRQDSSTSQMVFSVAEIVSFLSAVCTLEPGDVIATGTPAGVGYGKNPHPLLAVGDVVTCEIEGIGAISNAVVTPLGSSDGRQ